MMPIVSITAGTMLFCFRRYRLVLKLNILAETEENSLDIVSIVDDTNITALCPDFILSFFVGTR